MTNTGTRDGDEVVQFYVSGSATVVTRPAMQLVGFARVEAPAGATAAVTCTIPTSLLGYSGADGRCELEAGPLEVMVGRSSSKGPKRLRANPSRGPLRPCGGGPLVAEPGQQERPRTATVPRKMCTNTCAKPSSDTVNDSYLAARTSRNSSALQSGQVRCRRPQSRTIQMGYPPLPLLGSDPDCSQFPALDRSKSP